jgi:hypothetical protein
MNHTVCKFENKNLTQSMMITSVDMFCQLFLNKHAHQYASVYLFCGEEKKVWIQLYSLVWQLMRCSSQANVIPLHNIVCMLDYLNQIDRGPEIDEQFNNSLIVYRGDTNGLTM